MRQTTSRAGSPRIVILILAWMALLGYLPGAVADAAEDPGFARARARMVAAVEADVRATSDHIGFGRLDGAVMQALGSVQRHRFVPEEEQSRAYNNHPLPIGYGQTISQPYIVALMSNLLNPRPGDRVLEVGTGSGYQAAMLACMGAEVYSIEIIRPLAESAARRLQEQGYDKVQVKIGDGYFGWPEQAPFDHIVVTAAGDHVPPPLLAQLKNGGKMVIPVGGQFSVQHLILVTKDANGNLSSRQILPVRFVPLTRGP